MADDPVVAGAVGVDERLDTGVVRPESARERGRRHVAHAADTRADDIGLHRCSPPSLRM